MKAARPLKPPRHQWARLTDLTPGTDADLGRNTLVEGREFGELDIRARQLIALTLDECRVDRISAGDADLTGVTLRDVELGTLEAPVLRAARSDWSTVLIGSGRLGSAELYETRWNDVSVVGARIGLLNLRSSVLVDVTFRDCTIDEIDLAGAKVDRLAFPGSAIGEIITRNARMTDVDLSESSLRGPLDVAQLAGTHISEDQASQLAGAFARQLGVVVV